MDQDAQDADDSQVQILVIDDEPEVTELVARALLKAGHQVVTASSAEEGLEQLPYHTFQVAFIDHHLPQMEGLVLGDYLRKNNPYMQIALITGEVDPSLRKESEKLGISFIAKPFEIRLLFEVVERYLKEAAERTQAGARQADPNFHPQFLQHHAELAEYYSLPKLPDRIADHLGRRIKEILNNISSSARYNERDRVSALAGLLTARVLGLTLPRHKNGLSLYEYYDKIMFLNGRRPEFSPGEHHES